MSDTTGRPVPPNGMVSPPGLNRIGGWPTYLGQALHQGGRVQGLADPVSKVAGSQPHPEQSGTEEDASDVSDRGLARMEQPMMASAGETATRQLARLATAVGVLLLGLTGWGMFYYGFATPRAVTVAQASKIAALEGETARERETIRGLQIQLEAAFQREALLRAEAAASQSQGEALRDQGAGRRPITLQPQAKPKPHRAAKRIRPRPPANPTPGADLRPAPG